ncbi:BON domain-containing protein [Pararhizobium gei]|uniref:BON domain-containing protein n=1 Tax=Pararhizobium gei TaxID=1395951 RepID=UPI0023DB8761|nr:BON domain-containing protein [Rhizobium gei]
MQKQIYIRQDDHPDLTDDDLAGKVLRYIRYASLIDTTNLSVVALGRTIVLDGFVTCETDIGCVGEAAASVIGVHSVENRIKVVNH